MSGAGGASLEARARRAGVLTRYENDRHEVVVVDPEVVRAVVEAVEAGEPADRAGERAGEPADRDGERAGEPADRAGERAGEPADRDGPPRPPAARRGWGVFASVAALRTARTAGIGDLSDLDALFAGLAPAGADTVLTLPLLPGFVEPPAEPSPYSPISRRLWSELIVDPRRLPEAEAAGVTDLPRGAGGRLLDVPSAWEARKDALRAAAAVVFGTDGGRRRAALESFLDARPVVRAYARFRAAGIRHGRDWRRWPPGATGDPDDERLYLYAQWAAEEQVADVAARAAGRGQYLSLDLPVGTHPDGFDVWEAPDEYVAGLTVGAPPDAFFPLGQHWGFPPRHPRRGRGDDHRHLRECVRHHVRHAGLLRIDHVMALHRLYVTPDGAPARAGTYLTFPAEELYRVICDEAARAGAAVAGEDLGTVPAEIPLAMARHGLLGIHVMQFGVADPVPGGTLASFGTHDLPTFAAWWRGLDVGLRVELGLISEEQAGGARRERRAARAALVEALRARGSLAAGGRATVGVVLDAVLRDLAASPAPVVLANLEDLWLEPEPLNVPGTGAERPNWRRRHARAVEDLVADHRLAARLDLLSRRG